MIVQEKPTVAAFVRVNVPTGSESPSRRPRSCSRWTTRARFGGLTTRTVGFSEKIISIVVTLPPWVPSGSEGQESEAIDESRISWD